MWVAGGGFKAGYCHGATDEFAHYAVEGIVNQHDWLATVLKQFGLKHSQLKFKAGTGEVTLTQESAKAVMELLV